MNCRDSLEKLYEFLDGHLSGTPTSEIEVHLKRCRGCWDRFEFEKMLKERFQTSCKKETCPESLRRRIQSLLEKF